jgi:competence protein ComEA
MKLSRANWKNHRKGIVLRKKPLPLFPILLVGLTMAQPLLADDIQKININQASQAELTELKGIGPVLSQRIVEYREEYGPFQSPEDIMDVKGIGPKTWEKNKDRIITE